MKNIILIILSATIAIANTHDHANIMLKPYIKDMDTIKLKRLVKCNNNIVTGYVNSKDRYGDYMGYERFIGRKGFVLFEDAIGPEIMEQLIKKDCPNGYMRHKYLNEN